MKLTQEQSEHGGTVFTLDVGGFQLNLHVFPDDDVPVADLIGKAKPVPKEPEGSGGFRHVEFDSSMLQRGAYLEADELLRIMFANGDEYEYEGVPVGLWVGLLEADSSGRYFNEFIKNEYSCMKFEEV